MKLTTYVQIWILITCFLLYEYFALHFAPHRGLFRLAGYNFTPEPGRQLSLILGWIGFSLMVIMNVYMIRKRFGSLSGFGSLSSWLDFHIFCGLLGPTLIIFHCNLKVRGLVAISFWSMIVAATSGVVGRYFYIQLLTKGKDSEFESNHWNQKLKDLQIRANPAVADEQLEKIKTLALRFVGVEGEVQGMSLFSIFWHSLRGDIRLFSDLPLTLAGLGPASRMVLKNFALAERRRLFLKPFQRLLGYWHTFHTPFAIFMYVAAIIHIATALLLGV